MNTPLRRTTRGPERDSAIVETATGTVGAASTMTRNGKQHGTAWVASRGGQPGSTGPDLMGQGTFASVPPYSTDLNSHLSQQLRSVGDHLASTLTTDRAVSRPSARGLPVAQLLTQVHDGSLYYVVTAIDSRGRLADRSPLRILGWLPESSISINVVQGVVIVVTRSRGPGIITRQGHVRLPASVRHSCRLAPGARLLVAAYPDHDLLAVYTTSALEAMLLAYHVSLRKEVS